MGSSNVYSVEVSDPAVALGYIDVFQLDVHIVFRYELVSVHSRGESSAINGMDRSRQTFNEFASIRLAGVDLNGHLMSLESRRISYKMFHVSVCNPKA